MASMKASKEETAEERREREDSRASKTSELKASAMEAARKAREYFTGNKMETMQSELPKEKYKGTEDEVRKRMEEAKLKEEGIKDESKQRAEADRQTAADRGLAAKNNILSAMGGVAGSIKEKLTMPSDIRDEALATRQFGGRKRGKKTGIGEEETP